MTTPSTYSSVPLPDLEAEDSIVDEDSPPATVRDTSMHRSPSPTLESVRAAIQDSTRIDLHTAHALTSILYLIETQNRNNSARISENIRLYDDLRRERGRVDRLEQELAALRATLDHPPYLLLYPYNSCSVFNYYRSS